MCQFLADHLAGVVGLAHEAHDVVEAFDRDMVHGIAAERAEAPGHLVTGSAGVELLAAHGKDVIVIERAPHFGERCLVRVRGKLDAAHFGAERAGQGNDFESLKTMIA